MFWLMLSASLCSPQDPDFRRYAYPEHIAICRRSVDAAEKRIIAERDAITDWSMVEFDHRIPLCAGGSNALANVWAEPLADAKRKDRLEARVCRKLANGRMTQMQAIVELLVSNADQP